MSNSVVSLLLKVRNLISPGADDASESLRELEGRSRALERELARFEGAQAALQGLDQAAQAAASAQTEFERAQREVAELQSAMRGNPDPDVAVALATARERARDARREWDSSRKSVREMQEALRRAGVDVNDLTNAEEGLAEAARRTRDELDENSDELERMRRTLDGVSDAADDSSESISGWVGELFAVLAGLAIVDQIREGFIALTSSVFSVGDEFEKLSKRLSPDELRYVEEFARNTPMALDEVSEAFAKLRTFGIDPTNGSMQAAVDYNAKLGGSAESLDGIITALGQAWSKQKLQQEEVLQLVERGVPAWDLLAKSMGKSVPELQDLASAGALGREEITLLLDAMGAAATGQAASAMDSLSGIVSNLGNDLTSFYRTVADHGSLDSLKFALRTVQSQIKTMSEDGRLQRLAEKVSDFLSQTITASKDMAVALDENFGGIVGTSQIIANSISVIFNGLKSSLFGSAAVITKVVGELADLAGLDDFAAKAKAIAEGFEREFFEASKGVAEAGQGIAAGFEKLPKTFDEVTQSAKKSGEAAEAAGQQAEASANAAAKAAKQLAEEQEEASKKAAELYAQLDDLSLNYEQVFGGVSSGAQKAMEAIDGIAERIKETGEVTEREALGMQRVLLSAIPELDTLEALDTFEAKLESLGEQGLASAAGLAHVTDQLDEQRLTLTQAIPGLQSLEEAYKRLGITSSASLKQQAVDAKEAFEQIRSGGASLPDVERAFVSYAEKAIAANDGVTDATIRAGAEIYGVSDKIKNLSSESDEAAGSVAGLSRQVLVVGDSAKSTAADLDDVTNSTRGYTTQLGGFTNELGGFYSGLKNQLRDLVGSDAVRDFERILSGNSAATGNLAGDLDELGLVAAQAREEMSGLALDLARPDFIGLSRHMTQAKITFNELVIAADDARDSTDEIADSLDDLGESADSVAARMENMADSARSSLRSIRNELYALQDDQAAINEANYQAKKGELQVALSEAQAAGNDDAAASLEQALSILEQVRTIQRSNEEIAERRADAREKLEGALASIERQRELVTRDNTGAVLEYRLAELDSRAEEAQRKYDYTEKVLDDLEKKRTREQEKISGSSVGDYDDGYVSPSPSPSMPRPNPVADDDTGSQSPVFPLQSQVVKTVVVKLFDKSVEVAEGQEGKLLDMLELAAGRSV